MAPRELKSLGINLDRNVYNLDKIPAAERAEWKAWAGVGEILREHIDNVENNPKVFGEKLTRVRAKLNRAYHDWLFSPVETFIDFDPREYKVDDPAKDKRLVEKLNSVSRRIIDSAVLDDRKTKEGGGTGHHGTSILQDAPATRNLDAYELYQLKKESQVQKVPLGTQAAAISDQTEFSHTGKGLSEQLRKYQELAHAGGDTTNKRLLGMSGTFEEGKTTEAISSILERAALSHAQSDKASDSPLLKAWRNQQQAALTATDDGKALVDQLGQPLSAVKNFGDSQELVKAYRQLQVKPSLQTFLKDAADVSKFKQMAKAANPSTLRALGLVPFLGTGVGAATVEMQQKNRDKEIAENPNDFSLKINKHLDWWSGWGDRATAAGAVMSATGVGAAVGVPMMAAGEAVSSVAGLTSLGIDAGRAAINATNNRGPRTNWNDRLKARRSAR